MELGKNNWDRPSHVVGKNEGFLTYRNDPRFRQAFLSAPPQLAGAWCKAGLPIFPQNDVLQHPPLEGDFDFFSFAKRCPVQYF